MENLLDLWFGDVLGELEELSREAECVKVKEKNDGSSRTSKD